MQNMRSRKLTIWVMSISAVGFIATTATSWYFAFWLQRVEQLSSIASIAFGLVLIASTVVEIVRKVRTKRVLTEDAN